ncbi:glycosyl hydrolase [Anaeromicropila herbilytica]|uniref:Mannan endo-1,4-beta-mannosidase n=1 Tax=Anaeromicropila herbilytica TaxID=2785025 RepID=A0A7R7IDU1_9FIRM|nr:glycosyl hydrolase [Anaeromicropila herbilytica]BCN30368.1 mannan endo-1,4-beta-mannosidase [Anaeromicropila herbilytica]
MNNRTKKTKYFLPFILILMLILQTVCNKTPSKETNSQPKKSTASASSKESKKKTFNTLALKDIPINTSVKSIKNYLYEAEDSTLSGNVKSNKILKGYTGTGYVEGFQADNTDTCTFEIEIDESGAYDLNFRSASSDGGSKINFVALDGMNIGSISVEGKTFTDSKLNHIYIKKGKHTISVSKSWGYICLDSLSITSSKSLDKDTFHIASDLINPNATTRAKMLMKFLSDTYGKYVISGQYATLGLNSPEFQLIKEISGKVPAILGLDLIEYSPSRVAHGSTSYAINKAINFDKEGGIVTFCWHWNPPKEYLYNTDKIPWWKGFYKEGSSIDLEKIMNGEDKNGKDLLLKDIDAIAFQLKRLQSENIPILFRPLHEASGGWFWWGASGSEPYKQLWQLLYDRLTNYHKLNNLIWVWNGQDGDWYPGDNYVDIIAEDIYPGKNVTSTQSGKFNDALHYTKSHKLIALSENGFLPDPDSMFLDDARWSYFSTWSDEFILNTARDTSQQYISKEALKKVYNHDKVLTLDELPDLKNYPIN